MKVAIISTYYGDDIGGAEVSTKLAVSGLKKAGHNVDIITLSKKLEKIPLFLRAFLLNTKLLDSYIEKDILKKLNQTKPDIVHIQDLMIAPAAVKAAKKLKLKTIVTVRDLRFVCNLPLCQNYGKLFHNCNNKRYLKCLKREAKQQFNNSSLAYILFPLIRKRSKALRQSLSKANKLIALSQFVKSQLIKAKIKSKIDVVHNPIPDWEYRKPKPHKKFVLFAPGRLEKYKGFQLIIKAMSKIINKRPNTILWIAGTGTYGAQLKRLVEKLRLQKQVIFLGKLSQEQIRERYFDCDLVVFPSIWLEAQGRIPLEAMAAKKPLIANNTGGIIETAGKTNVCNMLNQDELVAEILKKRRSIKLRKDLSIDNFIKKIIIIYKDDETKTQREL